MTRAFEKHLNEAIEELHNFPYQTYSNKDELKRELDRTIAILSAISGYMSEDGTTHEQDQLLKEIGIKQS